MGRLVVVAYTPKPGAEEQLHRLVLDHVPRLRALGLVTDRRPVIMKAQDGVVIEVFEWASAEAIAEAHSHPAVQQMWAEFDQACDYVPAGRVEEMGRLFSEFEPLA